MASETFYFIPPGTPVPSVQELSDMMAPRERTPEQQVVNRLMDLAEREAGPEYWELTPPRVRTPEEEEAFTRVWDEFRAIARTLGTRVLITRALDA